MAHKEKASYAEMQEELEAILAQLQREDTDIDAALKQYARGLELIKALQDYLQTAKNTITKLDAEFDT